jgi:cell division protein FtsL
VTRVNLLLLAVLLASCLYLVKTSYESRRLFAALDRAKNEQGQLDTEFKRLDAEAKAQATNLRVEKVAREKLRMRTATPAVTQYVVDDAASAASSVSAASAASAAPKAVAP